MHKAALLVLLVPAVSLGWGFTGHRRLASMMQNPLPQSHCLRAWLLSKQSYALQDHACDPDRWRDSTSPTYDPLEYPRHFLEIDRASPPTAYPRSWADVLVAFPQYHELNGTVPWRSEAVYGQLVAAFRQKDTAKILDLAFVLSHYVTDAFSVLHDTKDYNPGGTLHLRWESDMLQVGAQLGVITDGGRHYFGTPGRADVRNNLFDVILVGNGLAPALSAAHYANPTDDAAFFRAVADLTARRWGDAATVLASILWTAWADAGAPSLSGFPGGCSMAVPTAEIELAGYPVPNGFTHPDGGGRLTPDASFVVPDAGDHDGGCLDCVDDDGGVRPDGGGEGGGGGSGGGFGGAGGGDAPPAGCGCAASLPGTLAALLAFALLRRRARLP